MRYLLCVLILLFITNFALAQEVPTEPPTKYRAQICWGAIEESKWQDVVITYNLAIGIPGVHKKNSKLGLQNWEAQCPNTIVQKVKFSFNIAEIPGMASFGYYYCRLQGYTEIDGVISAGTWSDVSDWVSIKEIGKPGKPANQN